VPPFDTSYRPDTWDREAERMAAVSGNRDRHAAFPNAGPGALSDGQLVVLLATAGGLLAATAFLVSTVLQARAARRPAPVVGRRQAIS